VNEFEKKYYEAEGFWTEQALSDAGNTARIEFTARSVPNDCKTLVDVGCGNGLFLRKVRELRPAVELFGVDRSNEALTYVDAEKAVGDISKLPFPDRSFDCVVCSQVLEHIPVPQYETALSELCRISIKHLIISVPYREDLIAAATTCPKCNSSFNRDLHLRTYTLDTMKNLVSGFGFQHVASETLVKTAKLLAVETIQKWTRPKPAPVFESPICVICGYENLGYSDYARKIKAPSSSGTSVGSSSKLKELVKRWWPKKTQDGYWVVSTYRRQD
jgi:SAM-dependent methyltransferase